MPEESATTLGGYSCRFLTLVFLELYAGEIRHNARGQLMMIFNTSLLRALCQIRIRHNDWGLLITSKLSSLRAPLQCNV
jgi:hypothetical protein